MKPKNLKQDKYKEGRKTYRGLEGSQRKTAYITDPTRTAGTMKISSTNLECQQIALQKNLQLKFYTLENEDK